MTKTQWFILLLNCNYYVNSQGPGGLNTGLTGWYNASGNYTAVTSAVSTWSDQSGNGRTATQGTAGNRPLVNSTGFNYNTTFAFDGMNDHFSIPDQMVSTATAVTTFAVARQTNNSRDDYACIVFGQGNTGGAGGYAITASDQNNNAFGFFVNDYTTHHVSYNGYNLSVPTIMAGNFNGSSTGNIQYYSSGTLAGSNAYASTVGDQGPSFIGTATTTGQFCFYGDIAEVAIFSVGVSSADMAKVDSYLGIKYGITKTTNYVNTSGNLIYATSAPYSSNIIGIARDDNTALMQKQSKTYDDTVRIFLSTLAASNSANAGSFSSDNQFVLLGSNTGRMYGINTEKPGSVQRRLEREWKVTNTGFTSTFNLNLKLAGIASATVLPADLRLLVDDDGDFSNATVYSSTDGLTFSYTNPLVTIAGINNTMIPSNSTKYITLASASLTTPLPIELLAFEGEMCGNEFCFTWETATEKNNDYFEVERSSEGLHWESISRVKGSGNSYTRLHYEARDPNPLTGLTYYRLKQVDLDGSYSHSRLIVLSSEIVSEFKVYPNPGNDYVEMDLPSSFLNQMEVYDCFGKRVEMEMVVVNNHVRVRTSNLPNGLYYIRFRDNLFLSGRTFIVAH